MARAKPPQALKLEIAESYESMSARAAAVVLRALLNNRRMLLCASAGGSPAKAYELIAARGAHSPGLFRQFRVLQIDEWAGLTPNHPASCRTDLQKKLIGPLGLGRNQFIGFATQSKAPERECRRISEWLSREGPIDLCILGLGKNGHIAMNEPAASLRPEAHVAKLSRSSMAHPLLRSVRPKPRYGMSLGMGDILRSKQILLLVSGEHKREAMAKLLSGKVTTRFPASFLWLHTNVTVLCDRAAMPERS